MFLKTGKKQSTSNKKNILHCQSSFLIRDNDTDRACNIETNLNFLELHSFVRNWVFRIGVKWASHLIQNSI